MASNGEEWAENEMAVEEQEVPSDMMQVSESEKQATDLDVPDTAGDAVSSPVVDIAEYDPDAAIGAAEEEGEEDEEEADGDEGEDGEEGEEDEGGEEEGNGDEGEAPADEAQDEPSGAAEPTEDAESTSAAVAAAPAKKPKAVGGFLVGDSDSEDDDDAAPAPAPAQADDDDGEEYDPAQITSSYEPPSANNGASAQTDTSRDGASYDPSHNPQDTQSAPTTTQNPPQANPVVPVPQQAPSPLAPFDNAGTVSVSALEARIKDDPRGALDSWLALIDDHRRNYRFDDARSTFDRFFEVFPQAVSCNS